MKILENSLLPTSQPRWPSMVILALVPINGDMHFGLNHSFIIPALNLNLLCLPCGANRLLAKIRLDSHLAICTTWVIKLV